MESVDLTKLDLDYVQSLSRVALQQLAKQCGLKVRTALHSAACGG